MGRRACSLFLLGRPLACHLGQGTRRNSTYIRAATNREKKLDFFSIGFLGYPTGRFFFTSQFFLENRQRKWQLPPSSDQVDMIWEIMVNYLKGKLLILEFKNIFDFQKMYKFLSFYFFFLNLFLLFFSRPDKFLANWIRKINQLHVLKNVF